MSTEKHRSLAAKYFVFFGGTSGIGQAAAEQVASEGAHVAVIGRDPNAGNDTVQRLQRKGAASAVFIKGDLSTINGAKNAATHVQQWSNRLDAIVHSAMSAFAGKTITKDGLEFAFALQYQARVVINSLLLDNLAASGDGRIIHLAGASPAFMMPDLDDLQFEKTSYSFYKAVLGSHNLGFMFIQEASKRWKDRPVSIVAACVGPTKTKSMSDSNMPFLMRLMGRFGTTAEVSSKYVVEYLRLLAIPENQRFGVMWDPKKADIGATQRPDGKARKLWDITSRISSDHGVPLSAMA
jgi:NAD(P)-dependent dehydrogenase (short-subunit alcohol dehydrogenase family)